MSRSQDNTAVMDMPVTQAPPTTNIPLGAQIDANLCGVYITIKRPSGRPMMKDAKVEATTVDNDSATVTSEDTTRPCWKIDIHPLWKDIDKNKGEIDNVLQEYSVSASIKGEHLVSMLKVGELLQELNKLRRQRRALAKQMQEVWDSEVVPGLQAKFPLHFENQIKDRLPDKKTLVDRFNVEWLIRPLTPMNNANLDLTALNETDAQEVIRLNEQFIQNLARQRFQTIFDEVFGEMMTLCDDIASGKYGFGKRKEGAMEEIMRMLDRVSNFSAFANAEVVEKTRVAKETLSRFTMKQANSSPMVQRSIQNALKPLGEALRSLTVQEVGNTRALRTVEI